MFDIFDFVQKSGLHVFIGAPHKEHPELMYLSVSTDDYSEEELFMVKQPDEKEEEFDARVKIRLEYLAAKIGSKTAVQISNTYASHKRAEIERFFKGE